MSPAHENISLRLFLPFSSLDPYFSAARGTQLSLPPSKPQQGIWKPSYPFWALLLSYPSQGIGTQLSWVTPVPCRLATSACLRKQHNQEPKHIPGPLGEPCPGGAGSWEEMGKHSEEYSFNDWGQPATEIKVKVTSGNNRTLEVYITCFYLPAQNTFTPAGKGGEV